MAWRVSASLGEAWNGTASRGLQWSTYRRSIGTAGSGTTGRGWAWRGRARDAMRHLLKGVDCGEG